MKTFQKLAIAATATLCLGVGSSSAERLKYGDYMPQGANEYARTAEWLGNEISKRSGGKHTVNMLWGGTVVKISEIPSAVENGVIDYGSLIVPYFPDQFPINNAISFFWPQPKSQEELGRLMLKWQAEIPAFAKEIDKFKLKMITVRPLPSYGIMCTKPVRTLADFKGLRIRSYGVALPAIIESLGAVPVSLADIESYEALSNGILDCSPGDPPLINGWKWQNVAKYFIDVPLGASWGHLMVMNRDKYNSLPDDLKKIINDLKEDYLTEFLKVYSKSVEDTRAAWKASGRVEFIQFPADEFLKATLGSPKVQAVREGWVKRAIAAGLPEADAKKVVQDLTN